jgi:hypothetical protein
MMTFARSTPWKSWKEWAVVYDLIKSGGILELRKALVFIREWSARGRLPIAVEATADIIDAFSCDPFYSDVSVSIPSKPLGLLYGNILSRFVSLVVDLGQKGAVAASMETIGGIAGFPGWIIQLRHAVSHAAEYPRIEILRKGVIELFEKCVVVKYWDVQASLIRNAEVEHKVEQSYTGQIVSHSVLKSYFTARESAGLDIALNQTTIPLLFHWIATNLDRIFSLGETEVGVRLMDIFRNLPNDELRRELIKQCLRYQSKNTIAFLLRQTESCAETKNVLFAEALRDTASNFLISDDLLETKLVSNGWDSNLFKSKGTSRPTPFEDSIGSYGGDSFFSNQGLLKPIHR